MPRHIRHLRNLIVDTLMGESDRFSREWAKRRSEILRYRRGW